MAGSPRTDGDLPLAGKYTRADGDRIIESGTIAEAMSLRAALLESVSHIDTQIEEARHRAPDSAWLSRVRGARRAYRVWLDRLAAKLSDSRDPRSAVLLRGVNTADRVTVALNALLDKGCHVVAFAVVGSDLVVIATEPKQANV